MQTHYLTLGVATTASQDDVKKAFRLLAHKYHPDKPGGDAERFKGITQAYATLSDPVKRRSYDLQMGVGRGLGSPVGMPQQQYRATHTYQTTQRNPFEGQAWSDLKRQAQQAGAGNSFDNFVDSVMKMKRQQDMNRGSSPF